MRSTRRPIPALLLALGCLAGLPAPAQQDQPAQPPAAATPPAEPAPEPAPPAQLVVRDLFVLQIDNYGDRANDPGLVRSTLTKPITENPQQIRRRLVLDDSKGYTNQPMPLGLITFEGEIRSPLAVKVEMLSNEAYIHAHHPYDAQSDGRFAQWLNVHEAKPTQRPVPIGGGGHWLERLRDADDLLWIASRDPLRKERFMLYDASFAFTPALDLEIKDQAYVAKSSLPGGQVPPLALLIHNRGGDWAASAPAGAWDNAQASFGKKPVDPAGFSPILEPVLKPLADLLAERGYTPTQVGLALDMVRAAGLENSEMSLVYVMPEGMLDEHVRLSIRPEPDRLVRTAIVVLTNADPDLPSRVKRLIVDLGSDRWQTRRDAHKALNQMGEAAIKQLQDERTNADPEIAFRAQQLLDAYDVSKKD